ncbi:MAG TPA: tandem-95 repeat protein [Thermoanaerobaculia bacterium]
MQFVVTGNLTLATGSGVFAENRASDGNGANITFTVGGNVLLQGTGVSTAGAIVSSSKLNGGNNFHAGDVTINAGGTVTQEGGSIIAACAQDSNAGAISITSGALSSIGGQILSGPTRTLTPSTFYTNVIMSGGGGHYVGGAITIRSFAHDEPGLTVTSTAIIASQGSETLPNTGNPVTLEGCGVQIHGLVASLAGQGTGPGVIVRSGTTLTIDSSTIGDPNGAHRASIRSDAWHEDGGAMYVKLEAAKAITVVGPPTSSTNFSVTSNPGTTDKRTAGTITVISTGGTLTASGNAFQVSGTHNGDRGGTVNISTKNDVNLNGATIDASGATSDGNRAGGHINVRSYSGALNWTSGVGDVRPIGSTAGVPAAQQGTISLTYCTTLSTSGTSFPANGSPVGVFPTTAQSCSPAAPSLPNGDTLPTCNTPPVANNTSATTNEDNSVTVTMTATDADGDSLTFTILTPPAHGTLGAIFNQTPTSAQVTYSPNANYNGSDSFTFQADDGKGGTSTGTVTITINPVNDPPTFNLGANPVTSNEDAGPQSIANYASSISPGPTADEASQTVTFTVTNDNNALFSVQPAISSSGTLTYTSAPNANGSANVTVVAHDNGGTANGGNDTSTSHVFNIVVNAVNDAPSFTKGADQTVFEDSGPHSVANWATAISAGPADESSQTVTFTVTNNNNALFSAQPAVASNGTLTFTTAANANGSATVTVTAHDDGGTANGGVDTSAPQTFTITVTAVNDPPSFTKGADVTVLEDSGAYAQAAWATSISAGPPDEADQTVHVNVTNNTNTALFSVQPAVANDGTLTFTTAADANGSATVTINAQDDGGTANGGVDTSASQTFVINVTAVNDAPSFTKGADQTSFEDAGPQTVAGWATAISAGPANESSQTVTFNVSNNNNALFSVQPAVASNGTLTYTAAANANGVATVTVAAHDDGGTANGGVDTSAPQTFTITVTAVNDPPSFTKGADQTVLEDSGAHAVAGWATAISPGPADESSQNVTFTVTNDNNALFSVQPAVAPDGTLTFTSAPDANGTATVTVTAHDDGGTANGGNDTSAPQTFVINVTAVNDAPSFTKGANQTSLEDAGPQTVAGWATGISAGPANESSQTVTFIVSNNNNSLFSSQPAVASNGALTYTSAPNANGTATVTVAAHDNGGTANGGVDTSPSQTFTITIVAVNDPPSFTSGGNVTVNEDSGAYSAAWATAISPGPADESGQSVTFHVSNDNNALFSSQPSLSPSGVLSFTTAPDANGTATVTVTLQDNGGTANGGNDTSAPQTFTITLNAVNDAPSFTPGGNVSTGDNAAYSAPWASSISPGPANESAQTVAFHVSNDNNSLFSVQPAISPSGVLSFTTAPDANGTATVTVTLQDNGGTANGGNDTSAPQTFTITLNAVNDAPSFTPGGNVSTGDNAAYSGPWASSISAGPANESGQTVAFHVSNDNNSLFSVQPAISPSGVLTFTPMAGHAGTATVSVFLQDNGGTANGGVDTSSTVTFTITITHVNTPPVANNDSYETIGNTQLEVAASHTTTTSVFVSGSVLANDTDSDGPSPLTASLASSTPGATVNVNSDGTFTYTPPAGFTGTDTFTYSVSDGAASATGTVSILVKSRVWYVKNDAPALGSGRSIDPFTALSSAQTSASAGDTIYVFTGDGTTTGQNSGIVLANANERLIGEGVALTVNVGVNGNPSPTTLRAAGTAPKIGNPSGDGVFSTNTSGIEVQGINVSGAPNAIHITTSAAGSGSATVANNIVNAATAEGIKVLGAGSGTLTVTLTNNIVTSTGNAIDASSTAGALHLSVDGNSVASLSSNGIAVSGAGTTVTSFGSNNVSGTTALDGVTMSGGVVFDAVPGLPLTAVSGGTSNIGTLGNGVGRNGVVLAGVVGDLSYASLSIYADNGSGLLVTGGGQFNGSTGTEVDAAAGSITATAGPAISMSNATAGLTLSSASSSSSVSTGISLTNVNGTVNAGSGIITGSAGVGVDISAGTANVTYNGNVATTSARPVQVQNTTGGLKSFGGAISGSGQGIFLNANTGATIAFSGAITLSSGTNDAFTATAGGTVTATGNGSILTTTTGTGVKVQNTTIGAAGLKFQSVSSNGGTNGILLSSTGNAGGLNVTGNGVAGSGGTVQNKTNAVSLSSTSNVQLAYMNLQNNSTAAINGTSVAGGTLDHVVVNGTNGTLTDAAVEFTGLTGQFNVTNSNISGGMTDNFRVANNAGELLNRLTVTGTTFGLNSTANGNDSLILQGTNGTMNVTIQNSTFTGAAGDIFQMDLHGTVASDLVFTGNAVSNNHPAIVSGGGGVTLDTGGPSDNVTFTYNISSNTFSGASGTALGIVKGSGTGTFSGTINGNTIGVSGVPNSGSQAGSAIFVSLIGGGSTTAHITNNQIFQYNNFGIALQIGSNSSGGIGGMNATITGNTIAQPGTSGFSMNGINLNAGTSSGDANFICASIGGAGALGNSITGSGANGGQDFRLRQRNATTVRLPGYAGANNDTAAVVTFVQSQNGGSPTGSATVAVPPGGGFVGGAACP